MPNLKDDLKKRGVGKPPTDKQPDLQQVTDAMYGGGLADILRKQGHVEMGEIGVDFVLDPQFQMRGEFKDGEWVPRLDSNHIGKLELIFEEGGTLPEGKEIRVAILPDGRRVVYDGWHRTTAAMNKGVTHLPAHYVEMSLLEALEAAEKANLEHDKALGMTSKEKKQIFFNRLSRGYEVSLDDGRVVLYAQMSANYLGQELNVDKQTISNWISEFGTTGENSPVDRTVTYGIDGREYDNSNIVAANKRRAEQEKLDGWLAMIPAASDEELATMQDYMQGTMRFEDYEFAEHRLWEDLRLEMEWRRDRDYLRGQFDRLKELDMAMLSNADFEAWFHLYQQADDYELEDHPYLHKIYEEKWKRENPDPSLDALEEMSTEDLRAIFGDARRKALTRQWAAAIIGRRNAEEKRRLDEKHAEASRPAQPTGAFYSVPQQLTRTRPVASDQSPVASKGEDKPQGYQPSATFRQPVQTPAKGSGGVLDGQSDADMTFALLLRSEFITSAAENRQALYKVRQVLNDAKAFWKHGLRMLHLVQDVGLLADDAGHVADLSEEILGMVREFSQFWDVTAAKLDGMAATGLPYDEGDFDGDES